MSSIYFTVESMPQATAFRYLFSVDTRSLHHSLCVCFLRDHQYMFVVRCLFMVKKVLSMTDKERLLSFSDCCNDLGG